ncbi:hypothetical protein ACLKA7_016667 [Drosophila subpalustris]
MSQKHSFAMWSLVIHTQRGPPTYTIACNQRRRQHWALAAAAAATSLTCPRPQTSWSGRCPPPNVHRGNSTEPVYFAQLDLYLLHWAIDFVNGHLSEKRGELKLLHINRF